MKGPHTHEKALPVGTSYKRGGEPCRCIELRWTGGGEHVPIPTSCGEIEAHQGDWLVLYDDGTQFVWRADVFPSFFYPL